MGEAPTFMEVFVYVFIIQVPEPSLGTKTNDAGAPVAENTDLAWPCTEGKDAAEALEPEGG